MPLPLAHTMIGLTTNEVLGRGSAPPDWKTVIFIVVLSNLPDLDIAAGLLVHGNGCAFHRGPTHSIAFAMLAGVLATNVSKLWPVIPRMNWIHSFLIVLSHVISDLLFTKSPVSLLWPLETHWVDGVSGWGESLMPIFLEAYKDVWVLLICLLMMMLVRLAATVKERTRTDLADYRFSGVGKDQRR